MINDLFFKRYPQQLIYADHVPTDVQTFLGQAVHIVFSDLTKPLSLDQNFFQKVHDSLARELGTGRLFNAERPDEICGRFLIERYDLWNNAHGNPDTFVKLRLSLIELIFREAERRVQALPERTLRKSFFRKRPNDNSDAAKNLLRKAIDELNDRFRETKIPLHYHNGIIQIAQDERSNRQIAEPCWEILSDPKWTSAETELKEALDRGDSGHSDAVFHAAKALESVIKIISDEKGWTSGTERGAAAFIDNLVSQTNGRFIEPWEAETLKLFFGKVRNPQGHGAGASPLPRLSGTQITWAIEYCMIWIKSLTRRL